MHNMQYDHEKSLAVLERIPVVLKALLNDLDDAWTMNNEGPETFSPFDVMGHLIHGEKTDWRPRIQRIIEHGNTKAFDTYDRFAMYEESKGKTINQLLHEFEVIRNENITWLKSLNITNADLNKKGMHPQLGEVSMENLLATWVVHDLTHIAQVTRVMAKQYKEVMGPWTQFFRILNF
ncbi:MAG: DinB family protein [Ginsengibacter sp.]